PLDVARQLGYELRRVARRVPPPGKVQRVVRPRVFVPPQRVAATAPPRGRALGSRGGVGGADQLRGVELADRAGRRLLPTGARRPRHGNSEGPLSGAVFVRVQY